MQPSEIWGMVFEVVRKELPVPTVWLAMQAVKALAIDGNYFVAALSPADHYLASHLQDNQTSTAIEDALRAITGRILAFRLIKGETLADWEVEKAHQSAPEPASVAPFNPSPTIQTVSGHGAPSQFVRPVPTNSSSAESPRTVSPTWEKLSERLTHGYKTAPYIKYPHGQAQYVLTAVKMISDTIDTLMPPPGAPRDDQTERALAKIIERLGSVVNLDPMFLSLELLRYRESQGKNLDIPL